LAFLFKILKPLPYLYKSVLKHIIALEGAIVFMDGGKVWDRAHVFNAGKLLIDVGGGFKLETPTRMLSLTYGRSLRDGTGTLAAYVQKRW